MNKEMIKKNLLTILCVVAIVALFLPLVSWTVESDFADMSQSITGFQVANQKFLGYLLLLGPVVLIAMNYVGQLQKYKPVLGIAVPIILILVLIIVFFQAKSIATAGNDAIGAMESGFGDFLDEDFDSGVGVKVSVGIGMIIAAISYVAMAVLGFKTYGNPAMFAQLKSAGAGFAETAQSKVAQAAQNVSGAVQNISSNVSSTIASNTTSSTGSNADRTEEILALIEKLSKMKDTGILSEEEFNEKKSKLLEEI